MKEREKGMRTDREEGDETIGAKEREIKIRDTQEEGEVVGGGGKKV